MRSEYDVVVAGGGLCGLAAAYKLCIAGKQTLVLEKDKALGGLSSSWDMHDYFIEKYYHHISGNNRFFCQFLEELGLGERLVWERSSTGYYYEGKIYQMDTPRDMLMFPGMNVIDLARLGLAILRVRMKKDFSDLDCVAAKDWIIKNTGTRVYVNFFEPLLRSKFGKNLECVSAAWLLGRIKFRSNRSPSGEKLGYIQTGFHELVEALEKRITEAGCDIETGVPIERVNVKDGTITGVHAGGSEIRCKTVISTVPPKELLGICYFPPSFKECLEKIHYQKTICATMILNRRLMDGIYWLNIKSEKTPFGALIEHTNFHNIPQYGVNHILYAVSYTNDDKDPLWKMTDEEIVTAYSEGIREIRQDFDRSWIRDFRITRRMYTGPIYERGYLGNIRKIKSPYPNLHITGMFMSYPERSMDDALRLGTAVASEVR